MLLNLVAPALPEKFGGVEPAGEVSRLLIDEKIDTGVLLADAFPPLARLQDFAATRVLSFQATTQLALAWAKAHAAVDAWAAAGPRYLQSCQHAPACYHSTSRKHGCFSAKSLEDTALSLVLGRAIAAAWRVGASSGLLPELRRELPDVREVDRMLRLVFSGASDPTNTWRARC